MRLEPLLSFAPVRAYNRFVDYRQHLASDPRIRSGKPCIVGTRIAVYDVLEYLASGMSVEDVLADFPHLTRDGILACLAYAANIEKSDPLAQVRRPDY